MQLTRHIWPGGPSSWAVIVAGVDVVRDTI